MLGFSIRKLNAYLRLAYGLPGFLQRRISAEQARNWIGERLQQREANFIHLLDAAIFRPPRNPYLALFDWAGINRDQTTRLVEQLGVEDTLRRLREAGVYLTFDEFKGRLPINRPGFQYPVSDSDFDNPWLSKYYAAQSGGSTGPGTRIRIDLDHITLQSPNYYLARQAQGLNDLPTALWRSGLPAPSGIGFMLRTLKVGGRLDQWFAPAIGDTFRPLLTHQLFTFYLFLIAGAVGTRLPRPEPLPLDRASVIAQWAAAAVAREGGAFLTASASMSLRVARAAMAEGLSMEGVTFSGGGEPVTTAKARAIAESGARLVPSYFMSEAGALGMHCADPIEVNDQHLFSDSFALFARARELPGFDTHVDAFHLTSLLPTSPKILFNVEIDDCGIIEERPCDCELGRIGLSTHLRRISSYSKLTGEGMTLVGSDMVRVLQEVLPARFGGGPLDYQLEERENAEAFTELVLRINPEIQIPSHDKVINEVLSALGRVDKGSDLARAIWAKARTMRVERAQPIWTEHGKLSPLITSIGRQERGKGEPTPRSSGQ